jgi:sarcosine oxidase gamma subunit
VVISTSRYAAEKMPRDPQRYNNPDIDKTMAEKLIANTRKVGETSVFPVGPDHLLIRYDRGTLRAHIEKADWKMLANK